MIELVTDSETLRKIQTTGGVAGSFKEKPLKEWLQRHNPTELEYNKVNHFFQMVILDVQTLAICIYDNIVHLKSFQN